ncbi:FAD-dependent oxidoreductase [Sulfobacillus harzensis]|uniref:NAD(P)/FAD-dependent oxidoreductase n=1 Tax=Sulfobacillus harzensis TaxID=2729629 RepID=A0A7Y0L3A0_9FIRM|nr:NAD(P)/FAD-dependent oxidoreductase [Sulfobacillus harzensis]NMP21926.1 NAD(P)/FAD-dependent oxidoreductase [Sulfobacillus harzensis]
MHFVILGAGPAGLQAGAEALALGHPVTILDPEGLGGNGLKHSLVPSKTLIRSANVLRAAASIGNSGPPGDWQRIMEWQHQRVDEGVRRAQELLKEARIIHEAGFLESPLEVVTQKTETRIRADVVIVATGSRQRTLPGLKPDGTRVWMPRVFHDLKKLPSELAIIGAGATGLEAAALFASFGVFVHLYFASDSLLPEMDGGIGDRLTASLKDLGVALCGDRRVTALAPGEMGGVRIDWTSQVGTGHDVRARVLLAAGREPVLERASLEGLGFDLDAQGFFRVDAYGRTNVAQVYAVGDAAGAPLLANKAWSQGWWAVRDALGMAPEKYPGPTVHAIYTHPEIAWVGETSSFRFGGEVFVPWLYESLLKDGPGPYVIVYTDANGRLVGGEAIGSHASEMMSALGLAISGGLSIETLGAFQPASPSSGELLAWVAQERRLMG